MRVTKAKIQGLATGVGLLGAGLVATLLYFLLKKPSACPPCNCYADAVGPWKQADQG